MATTTENITQALRRGALENAPDFTRMRKKLDKTVRSTRKSINRGVRTTDAYVHKHPWAAVGAVAGIVALAGIAMAVLVRRPPTVRRALPGGVEELLKSATARLRELRK